MCTDADIERLRLAAIPRSALRHHEQRWTWQIADHCVYLLAWHDQEVVGRATVLRRSKYQRVRDTIGEVPEINALEVALEGRGIGTALMHSSEQWAIRWGAAVIGLGVGPANGRAIRLYEHLGYADWGHGTVVDQWTEHDDESASVHEHADECLYMTKTLGG
jgi:GNAT superfamily N-acetyltransferase